MQTVSTSTSRRSPSVGDLFGSTRPFAFAGGDENLRRYVGNGPADATDPTGLEATRRTREQEAARDEIQRRIEQYRAAFTVDEHALTLLLLWLDGDGSPLTLDDRQATPVGHPLEAFVRAEQSNFLNRMRQHPILANAIKEEVLEGVSMAIASRGALHRSYGPRNFTFPENSYGPDSLYGYLHHGKISGDTHYDVRPCPGGGWIINYNGFATYKDTIDMNAAAGDEFFSQWVDPAGGGHDYELSFTWQYSGQIEVDSAGRQRAATGYPFRPYVGYGGSGNNSRR